MTDTPEYPTERMAAERVSAGPIVSQAVARSAPAAVYKRPIAAALLEESPPTLDDQRSLVYIPAVRPPPVDQPEPPAPEEDVHWSPPEPPHRAEHGHDVQPQLDLRELRLRLTAEPAEGRVAGPPRVRPVKARRRARQIPWGPIAVAGGGFLAVAMAFAVAMAWLPELGASQPEAPSVVGPHPPLPPAGSVGQPPK